MNASIIDIKVNKSIPEFQYHLLRAAINKYKKNLTQLSSQELSEVKKMANKSFELESKVLNAPKAASIEITEKSVSTAIAEVESRYANRDEFISDLEQNALNPDILASALKRELQFDAILNSLIDEIPAVSEVDAQIYYQLNKEKFTKPEQRKVKQILITINDEFAENSRQNSQAKINMLHSKLIKNSARFNQLAKKFSECPSAMDGGELGTLKQGVLYPELDCALFSLNEGKISEVIETELGFHILLCEKVYKSISLPYSKIKTQVLDSLIQKNIRHYQKNWIDSL